MGIPVPISRRRRQLIAAAGAIGMEAVARAEPDGYTIQVMSSGVLRRLLFYPKLSFDIIRSLVVEA